LNPVISGLKQETFPEKRPGGLNVP